MYKKELKCRIITLALTFFLCLLLPCLSNAQALSNFSADVVSIVDGDTVDVLDRSTMTQYRIRLAHMDAPERSQAFGTRAKQALSTLIFGKTVYIEYISMTGNQKPRVLGVIYLDNQNINAEMVRLGFAWAYRFQGKPSDESYAVLEAQAKASRLGLWLENKPIEPWRFRRSNRLR